jgi:allene oxide cyclase
VNARRPLLAILLLAPALLAGCGGGDSGSSAAAEPTTLHVIEHATTNTVQHIGPASEKDSVGDVLGYANPLFDAANEKRVGSDNGMCIRTVVGDAWECMWTNTLEDGQIIVEGPFYDDRSSDVAITGGTGAYEGVRGDMKLRYRDPQGSEYDFIFHIQ